MSFPLEPDFAVIKIGDGATPEVFTVLCGIDQVSVNSVVNTADRFRRDCAKPGAVPKRKVQAQGTQTDISGSGVFNVDQVAEFRAALGITRNYRVEIGRRDGTDAGEIMGHFTGPFMMTANNISVGDEGSAEITLASDGDVVWTPAP